MKILRWNCRGLGNPRIVRELRQLVKNKRPEVVFIMETKMLSTKLDPIRSKLGFKNVFGVDSCGKSGGLALFWQEEVKLEIHNYSRRHINAIVSGEGRTPWKLSGFYGHLDVSKRGEVWGLMRTLATFQPEAWVVIGDFNEIVESSEKQGVGNRPRSQMEAFQRVISDCGLSDLGYRGLKYTWLNCQEEGSFVRERLDRGMANAEWRFMFSVAEIYTELVECSDNYPILLSTRKVWQNSYKKRGFIYDATWSQDIEFGDLIKKVWRAKGLFLDTWTTVKQKLDECKKELSRWKKNHVGVLERDIQEKSKQLQSLQEVEGVPDIGALKKLRTELMILKDQEDLVWRQRAREDWLQYGDRNTKFFHASTKQKRRANHLEKIKDEEGKSWGTQEDIGRVFIEYYRRLFTSEGASEVRRCIRAVTSRVSDEANRSLLADFSGEEISQAVHQMAPCKAPGPDGFTADFYQKHWATIGSEVCNLVLSILNSGHMNEDFNSTYIALIPKIKNPTSVTEFRPISLCNVLYKIVSRVLANRLKCVLPDIIAPTQSAFIPGRLISDNILAAYETLHTMQSRMWSKERYMAVKLDMSKAYDRMEWRFLEKVMKRMGFVDRWIGLIMMCVKSANYAILINGSPMGRIQPTRGIRQGDPISPYLFLICAKALSGLLSKADQKGQLRGVPT
jgi:hypothetical protein